MWEPGTKYTGLFRPEWELLNCSITVTSSLKGVNNFERRGGEGCVVQLLLSNTCRWCAMKLACSRRWPRWSNSPLLLMEKEQKKVRSTHLTPLRPYKTGNNSWHFKATALFSTSSLSVSLFFFFRASCLQPPLSGFPHFPQLTKK